MKKKVIKIILAIILVLIWWVISKNNLPYLLDWSSAQLVGYNMATLAIAGLFGYIIYKDLKKDWGN